MKKKLLLAAVTGSALVCFSLPAISMGLPETAPAASQPTAVTADSADSQPSTQRAWWTAERDSDGIDAPRTAAPKAKRRHAAHRAHVAKIAAVSHQFDVVEPDAALSQPMSDKEFDAEMAQAEARYRQNVAEIAQASMPAQMPGAQSWNGDTSQTPAPTPIDSSTQIPGNSPSQVQMETSTQIQSTDVSQPAGVQTAAPSQTANISNLKPFSLEANYMSLPGDLRYRTYASTGNWMTRDEAVAAANDQQQSATR
jgi:hypothetical protein